MAELRGLTGAERDAVNAAMHEQRALGGLVSFGELTEEQQAQALLPGKPARGWWDTAEHRLGQAKQWMYRVDENGRVKRAAFASAAERGDG